MKKVILVTLIICFLSGCSSLMKPQSPPQPDRAVTKHYIKNVKFQRSDGKMSTAPSFSISTPIIENDLTNARVNLYKAGANVCWKTSDGNFFVSKDEQFVLTKDYLHLVWLVVCDPEGYMANKADNKKVFTPQYLIKYGPKNIKQ